MRQPKREQTPPQPCETCGNPTQRGDMGLCRTCDADWFEIAGNGLEAMGAEVARMQHARDERMGRCRTCGGLGQTDAVGADGALRWPQRVQTCDCAAGESSRAALLSATGLPRRYWDLAPIPAAEGESAYLWGPTGAGKSCRAAQALKAWVLAHPNRSAQWVSLTAFGEERRWAIGNGATDPAEALRRAEFAVLDDLAKERLTPYEWQALWGVIDWRYNRGASVVTVFTSELRPRDLAARLDRDLPDKPGAAAARRIGDMVGANVFRLAMTSGGQTEQRSRVA